MGRPRFGAALLELCWLGQSWPVLWSLLLSWFLTCWARTGNEPDSDSRPWQDLSDLGQKFRATLVRLVLVAGLLLRGLLWAGEKRKRRPSG